MGLTAYLVLPGLALGALAAWSLGRIAGDGLRPWQKRALGAGLILMTPIVLSLLAFLLLPCR